MSNHTYVGVFFSLFFLCLSANMRAMWPFDSVIRWARAKEVQNLRSKERERMKQEIGDKNLKKIAQHAEIDESCDRGCYWFPFGVNTPKQIADFKDVQKKSRNDQYVVSEENKRNREGFGKHIQGLFDRRNSCSGKSDKHYISCRRGRIDKRTQYINNASVTTTPTAGGMVRKVLHKKINGGQEVYSGDMIQENRSLLVDAYFSVTNKNHETARELIEALEALDNISARSKLSSLKAYTSVAQPYEDIVKAALNKLGV